MAERYERRSLILTSNLVFSEWDRIFVGRRWQTRKHGDDAL